jgi:hypothetical protein
LWLETLVGGETAGAGLTLAATAYR